MDISFAGWTKKLTNIRQFYRKLSECISDSDESMNITNEEKSPQKVVSFKEPVNKKQNIDRKKTLNL